MEIRQLKYFLAVADQRSFVSAANLLYISRQAISKAVAQLEQELQVELFMRDSNGAFLTPVGVLFYDRVRGAVTEFDAIRQEMLSYGMRYRQRLRLGFSVGTLPPLEERLLAFCERQKNADIDYAEYPQDYCRSLMLERKLDAAIVAQEISDASISSVPLLQSKIGAMLQLYAPLAEKEILTAADLTGQPLAAHTELSLPQGLALSFTGYDYSRLQRLAEQGRCVLLLPALLARGVQEQLIFRPVADMPEWTVYAARQRSSNIGALPDTLLDELLQDLKLEEALHG